MDFHPLYFYQKVPLGEPIVGKPFYPPGEEEFVKKGEVILTTAALVITALAVAAAGATAVYNTWRGTPPVIESNIYPLWTGDLDLSPEEKRKLLEAAATANAESLDRVMEPQEKKEKAEEEAAAKAENPSMATGSKEKQPVQAAKPRIDLSKPVDPTNFTIPTIPRTSNGRAVPFNYKTVVPGMVLGAGLGLLAGRGSVLPALLGGAAGAGIGYFLGGDWQRNRPMSTITKGQLPPNTFGMNPTAQGQVPPQHPVNTSPVVAQGQVPKQQPASPVVPSPQTQPSNPPAPVSAASTHPMGVQGTNNQEVR